VVVTAASIEHKDVVLGLLGASAALSGLVLVFLGIVVTTYQGYGAQAGDEILNKYRQDALLVLSSLIAGLICLALCVVWLVSLRDHHPNIYVAALAGFFAQLAFLTIAASRVTYRVMWS
jgi:hypothetical protein